MLDVLFEGGADEAGIFSELEAETGISLSSLEFTEMYMDFGEVFQIAMSGAEDLESEFPNFGVVLRGDDIDEDDFVLRLEEASEADPGVNYEATAYRGYQIHADADEGAEGFAFSFADQDSLLLGTQDGIKAMLDVASGAAPQISGEGVRALDSLGDRDLGLILAIPEGLLDEASGGGDGDGNPMALLGLGGLTPELTVVALRFNDRSVRVHSVEIYKDESVAAAAKEYNEGAIAMVGAMFGSAEIQDLVAGSDIRQERNRVSYRLSVDEPAAVAILDFLTSFADLSLPPQS